MTTTAAYIDLPFDAAIAHFRAKVDIPTEKWNDLWRQMHARGFMSAGAMKAELLTDLRSAVDKAIATGTTIAEFRNDFDALVAKHDWAYKGGRGWRTRVIYDTNIRQAYNAGRWKQITDPDVIAARPYLQYKHGGSINPRPEHMAWDGLVLPADDPWWRTHYPQNGWGCRCKVFTLSQRDLKRQGKAGPDSAPQDGTYQWTDKQGRTHTILKGIDPGWDYNVGQASWGRTRASQLAEDQGPWEDLSPKTPADYGRPRLMPVDTAVAALGKHVRKGDEAGLRRSLQDAIGGDEALITDPLGEPIMITPAVVDHMLETPARLDGREAYFPLIRELIEDPYEIWIGFARSKIKNGDRYFMLDTNKLLHDKKLKKKPDYIGFWGGLRYPPNEAEMYKLCSQLL